MLNLRHIPRGLRAAARRAITCDDFYAVNGFFMYASSDVAMLLFMDNENYFKKHGLYEKALLYAWAHQKVNVLQIGDRVSSWDHFMRNCLQLCADSDALLAAGDPLPLGDPLTIYRGVRGRGKRNLRGISWTLSLEVAKKFSKRFPTLENFRPAVYQTTVRRSDVYAYLNSFREGEQEVLVVLSKRHPITKVGVE
jgi:hypothetical protein